MKLIFLLETKFVLSVKYSEHLDKSTIWLVIVAKSFLQHNCKGFHLNPFSFSTLQTAVKNGTNYPLSGPSAGNCRCDNQSDNWRTYHVDCGDGCTSAGDRTYQLPFRQLCHIQFARPQCVYVSFATTPLTRFSMLSIPIHRLIWACGYGTSPRDISLCASEKGYGICGSIIG